MANAIHIDKQGAIFIDNQKRTGLDVVGWFFGGRKNTRASFSWGIVLAAVFELPLPRNIQKPKTRLNFKLLKRKLFFFRVDVFE
jgi:hypothetical protein